MSELRPRSDRSVVKTSGIARHGRLRKAGPWGAILAFIGATLAVVLVSGAALAGIVVNQLNNNLKPGVELIQPTDAPPPSVGAYPVASTCSSSAATSARTTAAAPVAARPTSTM